MYKRIVSLLLCAVMLFSLSSTVFALNPFDDFDDDEMNSLIDSNGGPGDFLDGPMSEKDMLGTLLTDMAQILKRIDEYDKYTKACKFSMQLAAGFRAVSGVLGLVNGTVSFLRLIGVLETPGSSQLTEIYENVLDIRERVEEINVKADEIRVTLGSEFSKVDFNFNISEYVDYQQAWTDFFTEGGSAALMEKYFAEYQSQVNADLLDYVKQWKTDCEYGIRALYNDDTEPVLLYSGDNMDGAGKPLPLVPDWADESVIKAVTYNCKVSKYVTLPGAYIKVANVKLNADNSVEALYDAVLDGVTRAIADKALIVNDSSFYDSFAAKSADEQAELCEKLAADLVNSLSYDVSHSVANASSGSGTFASRVKAAYDVFCSTVAGENSVTSPIVSGFKRLSLTHGFEGEIKDEFTEIFAYISSLTSEYTAFTSFVCSLDDSMTSELKGAVSSASITTMNALIKYYRSYITGNDNYCYPLGYAIEYHDVTFRATHTLHFKSKNEEHYTYDTLVETGDWQLIDETVYNPDLSDTETLTGIETALKSKMLTTRDIALIYYYYQNHTRETGSSDSFLDYLCANDALFLTTPDADTADRSTQLITANYSVKPLEFDGTLELTAHVEDDAKEHLVYEEDASVKMDKKAFDKGYDYRGYPRSYDMIVGDMFEAADGYAGSTGISDVANRIRLGAVYTARFYSNPTYELAWSGYGGESMTLRGEKYYGEDVVEHFAFTDGEFISGVDALKDSQFGPITSVIEKSMGTLVAVPAGNVTIGANVKKVDKTTVSSKNVQCVTIASHETQIASDAFTGFGTASNRVLLRTVNRGTPSLVEKWNGGYFGNAIITLESANKAAQTRKIIVAYGDATKNISCPFSAESGKVFSGWSAETVSPDTETLTAVWSTHVHEPQYISKEPTCTEAGYTTYSVCKICGKQLTNPVTIPATGHSYSFSSINSKMIGKCDHCGKELEFITGEVGSFRIAVAGTSSAAAFSYDSSSRILTIKNDDLIILRNKNTGSAASDSIAIADGVSANVVLDGVNIKTPQNVPAFGIADDSVGQVVITLAAGSVNILHSGANCAGIQKNGNNGTLTINGTGTLAAIGGTCGAGIGSAGDSNAAFGKPVNGTANITINGGNIYAASDDDNSPGIGAAYKSMGPVATQGTASNIVINGGSVTVDSYNTAIGGSAGSLCIRGGAVTVNSTVGRSDTSDPGEFSIVFYPMASVYLDRAPKNTTIYNEKKQIVVAHYYDTTDVIHHSDGFFRSYDEHIAPVTKITVDGYTLPFTRHMAVTSEGKLKAKDSVYLYGPTGDLNVTVERDANFTGSIFGESGIWLMISGGVVLCAGIAAAVIITRKRKKQKNVTDEEMTL